MKISLYTENGAANSIPVFTAFADGARALGHEVIFNQMNADIIVIWSILWHGKMKQNHAIWLTCKRIGIPIIVLEVGGLSRGKLWRVGLNHINANGIFGNDRDLDMQRSRKLGISLRPWSSGANILICGQHSKSEQWVNKPAPVSWLRQLVDDISIYSDKPIIFRPHPRDFDWCDHELLRGITIHRPKKIIGSYDDFNHDEDFKSAACVINPSSNTGILAAIAGKPIFTDKDSLAFPVSNTSLHTLNKPLTSDRSVWLEKICHTEWSIDEIRTGIPLNRLLKTLTN